MTTSPVCSTAPSTAFPATEESPVEDDEEDFCFPSSQVTLSQGMSQTDETIRRLEREGELVDVVGSQSLLSQELICSSQRSEGCVDEGILELSQQENSSAMARRLGLLSQEARDPEMEEVDAPFVPSQDLSINFSQSDLVKLNIKSPPPNENEKSAGISDTPFRESECFGSLLEAVEKITREEEELHVGVGTKVLSWQFCESGGSSDLESTPQNPQEGSINGTRNQSDSLKRKKPTPKTKPPPSPNKKSRKHTSTKKKETEQRKAQEVAKRAAALAEQTITDPEMAKKLLLSMALVRENPRSVPSVLPPRGSVVPEGFFWAHYPPLEAVLKKHMAEYYDLSTTRCQSAEQQSFNNDLVVLVRDVAKEQGWKFHQTFSDKGLRDRIRCYYKTHIQNAKKRLRTMVRNPTKRANARHLCAHLDLIERHGTDHLSEGILFPDGDEDEQEENDSNDGDSAGEKASDSDPRMDTAPTEASVPQNIQVAGRTTIVVQI